MNGCDIYYINVQLLIKYFQKKINGYLIGFRWVVEFSVGQIKIIANTIFSIFLMLFFQHYLDFN